MCELPCSGCWGEKSRSLWERGCGEQWVSVGGELCQCLTLLPKETVQPKQGHRWAGEVGPGLGLKGPFSCSCRLPDAPARHPLAASFPGPSLSACSVSQPAQPCPGVETWSREPGLRQLFHSGCSGYVLLPPPTTLPRREDTSKQAPCCSGAAPWAKTRAGHTRPHVQLNTHPYTHNVAPQVPGTRREQQQEFILRLPPTLKQWRGDAAARFDGAKTLRLV